MRRRLVLAIAGVAAVAIALFAVPLALVLGDAHRTSDLLRLQRDTFAATRQIDLAHGHGDAIELPPSRDQLAVYDRSGRLVAGSGPIRAPAVVRRALATGRPTEQPGGGPLAVAVPLLSGEQVTGAVRALRPAGEASGQTTGERLALMGIALGIVGAAVLAALWLGRALARPLERLAGAATRLGHGDFSARAPAAGIPEVDEVGAALGATAERLEDLVTRERAFSADASHQLRTPLQALRIELEAAQLRGDAPPEIAAALTQVDRLESTIDTLLAIARDTPRRATTTDIGAAIGAAQARWHGLLAASSRPLQATPPRALVASSDPQVVDQVLDVLLDNAASHGAGPVRLDVRELDGWVAIDVGDDGAGFGAGAEAAFARRAGEATNGHGIGLALARSLAHAEGGRLTVTDPGPAPVVTLFLPLNR